MVLGKLNILVQKNETKSLFYSIIKINSNELKTNLKPETTTKKTKNKQTKELLEEKVGQKFCDRVFGNDFKIYDT